MSRPNVPEEELLRLWRTCGSETEKRRLLEELLDPYLERISRWARRICRHQVEAEDVAQETLRAVCEHLDQFRGECRFSTWVYAIVRNQAIKRAAREPRAVFVPLDAIDERTVVDDDLDPAQAFEFRRQVEEVRQMIDRDLTSLEATVFLLHFGMGIPLAVLDEELELQNRSGSRAFLVSAKRKLRRRIDRKNPGAQGPARSTSRRAWISSERKKP